ncbi:hypothetical protein K501DRAFT_280300 [Backusella circina FSU 941]|nr:hypothetical protein K501DRAFT_280300 [Backusella circina FSU 941]
MAPNMSPHVSKSGVLSSSKSDIDKIGWKDEYKEALEDYVLCVHKVTSHSYTFCKFMFLSELELDDNFQYSAFINVSFFKEVFLSLTDYNRTATPPKDEQHNIELIQKHLSTYLTLANLTPIKILNAERTADYEAVKIDRAYRQMVKHKVDKGIRRAVNLILKVNEKKTALRTELMNEGIEGDKIKDRINEDILGPIRKFKEELLAGNLQNVDEFLGSDRDLILDVFRAYPANYRFKDDSLSVDARENPLPHFLPMFRLAKSLGKIDERGFLCFPLRKTFIPCYTMIDTETLCTSILKISRDKFQDDYQAWGSVVNIHHEAFQLEENQSFTGTVLTNGLGIKINKHQKVPDPEEDALQIDDEVQDSTPYIHQMSQDELITLERKCVLVDPGSNDLLYCLHETSDMDNPITYSYTNKQRCLYLTNNGEYNKAFQVVRMEDPDFVQAERLLSQYSTRNVSLETFTQYTRARGTVNKILWSHYTNTKVQDSEGTLIGYRKKKLLIDHKKKEAWMVMIEEMKNAFGLGAVLIFGDWSTFGSRRRVPAGHVRDLLKENGFQIAFVDEFRSSKTCPSCHQHSLEKIEGSFNVNDQDEIIRPDSNGTNLLRCSTLTCTNSQGKQRVWDRNYAAALNFRIILFSLRKLGIYPPQFQRPQFSFSSF